MTTVPGPFARHTPMELLAPAGSLAAFEAALSEGADAVYAGAPRFNARALSRDFTVAEIGAMADFARERGRKFYVAMNSLVKESEVPSALQILAALARIQPDALIVQDLGVVHLARRYFPELGLHASTLMTITNSLGANFLGGQGFRRVVLARELSIDDIREIHAQSEVALEVFIHGAMCFSYSGLCRFSSLHGGKSSLRGQCVQPCRRRYEWQPSGKKSSGQRGAGAGGYLFSMNDLSGIDCLAPLRDAGVASLKIEGRLKPVSYVRHAVRAYRLALDGLDAGEEDRLDMLGEARRHLEAAMGRRRSSGFFLVGGDSSLIQPQLSGNTGEVVGRVVKAEDGQGRQGSGRRLLHVVLQAPVAIGDRLRFYDEQSGDRKSFTLRRLSADGATLERGRQGQKVVMGLGSAEIGALTPGRGLLFRVDVSGRSESASPRLAALIAEQRPPRVDPRHLGQLLASLSPSDEVGGSQDGGSRRRVDRRRPQVERSGFEWWLRVNTPADVRFHWPFPVSRLLIDCTAEGLQQFVAAGGRRRGRIPLVWTLPAIIREERLAWYRMAIAQAIAAGADRFQLGHPAQVDLFRQPGVGHLHRGVSLYGDDSFNVLNRAALLAVAAQGLAGVQFSLETDRETLTTALSAYGAGRDRQVGSVSPLQVGLLLYGRPALFTARLDAPHFQGHRSLTSTRGERYYLERSEEAVQVRSHEAFSLLHRAGELARSGLAYGIVDVSRGAIQREHAAVVALLSGRTASSSPVSSGNFEGGLV